MHRTTAILAIAGAAAAAPIDFAKLNTGTWVNPGVNIGQVYGASEVSWAYDRHHRKFVRFGGCSGGYTNEVFACWFDGSGNFVSEQIIAPGTSGGDNRPGAGCSRGICYDSKRHIVWGYGGIGASPIPTSGKGWALMGLDLGDKSFRMAPGSDGFRMGEACQIEYGEGDDAILLVGRDAGAWHQTWLYEFSTSKWRKIGKEWDPNASGPRNGINLTYFHPVYDPESRSFVLLLGSQPQTWVFTPSTMTDWEVRTPSPSPPARTRYGSAYDPVMRRIILHGGRNGETDTWAYNVRANQWTRIQTSGALTPGTDGMMPFDYDSEHNVFVSYSYKSDMIHPVQVFRNLTPGTSITAPPRLTRGEDRSLRNPIRSLLELEDPGLAGNTNAALYSTDGRRVWKSGQTGSLKAGNYLFTPGRAAGSPTAWKITVAK